MNLNRLRLFDQSHNLYITDPGPSSSIVKWSLTCSSSIYHSNVRGQSRRVATKAHGWFLHKVSLCPVSQMFNWCNFFIWFFLWKSPQPSILKTIDIHDIKIVQSFVVHNPSYPFMHSWIFLNRLMPRSLPYQISSFISIVPSCKYVK